MKIDNETLKQWAEKDLTVICGAHYPFDGLIVSKIDGSTFCGISGEVDRNSFESDATIEPDDSARFILAAPTLAAEVLALRKALIAAQTGFQNLVDWTETKDFDDVIEIIDQALKGGDL